MQEEEGKQVFLDGVSRFEYLKAYCPQCGRRACLTQTLDYADSEAARSVCPNAAEGQLQCTGPCCHGCECFQAGDCDEFPETKCRCDCHLTRLRQPVVFLDLVAEEEAAARCLCAMCLGGAVREPVLEYWPGYDGTEGHWVSNRPRDCRHFGRDVTAAATTTGSQPIISTFYDNSDGRNHRLDRYFSRVDSQ